MSRMRFNPEVARIAPPPIPEVQGWGAAHGGASGPLIDLSQAVPGYPPHPDLLSWLAEAAGSTASAGYGEIEGEPVLRRAYATWMESLYAAPIAPAEIHITAGCNQAFFATALAVAGAGDTVLLTNPNYFNHAATLQMLGIGTRAVECRAAVGFVPDPEAVAAAIGPQVRALALVTPNNPTGAVYPPDLMDALFSLCRARGIWLIVDETYRDFRLPEAGAPHGLFARSGWQDTVISLYSFSKSFCIPGHRLGAVTAGRPVIAEIAKVMDNLQICAPRAAQQALAQAIPALAGWRTENGAEIAARAAALQTGLGGLAGWDLAAIGAYFAFVRHPHRGLSAVSAARRLAESAGILTLPGSYFGTGLDDYLRIAFANADAPTLAGLPGRLAAAAALQD